MRNDPIVAEVRKTREKLAARFGFDLDAMFHDARKRQTARTPLRRKGKLLVLPKRDVAANAVKAVEETRSDRG